MTATQAKSMTCPKRLSPGSPVSTGLPRSAGDAFWLFTVDARLVLQATETALKVWNKAVDDRLAWSVVSLTARRADQPDDLPGLPKLLGIAEVAKRLDVSKQRATELARTHRLFPPPLAELASGPIWTAWQIGAFQRSWTRKPGRPLATT